MQFTSQQMTYFFNCNQGVTFFIMREDTQILLLNFIKITEKYSTSFLTTISTAMLKIHKTLFEHIFCFSPYFIRKKELFHYLLFCKLFKNSVQWWENDGFVETKVAKRIKISIFTKKIILFFFLFTKFQQQEPVHWRAHHVQLIICSMVVYVWSVWVHNSMIRWHKRAKRAMNRADHAAVQVNIHALHARSRCI